MDWRSFATLAGAKAAVSKAGLHLLPHRFDLIFGSRIRPVFTPELEEDRDHLRERFWCAERPSPSKEPAQ